MPRDRSTRDSLTLHEIAKRYVAGAGSCSIGVTALRCASIEIRCGEVVVVAGPVGSGKTTLLLCAAGLLSCDAGSVTGSRRRVTYRDLRAPPRPIELMTAGSILLLDSCDDLSDLAKVGLSYVTAAALAVGAGVVLAGRDASDCLAISPPHVTVSVVHLRLGETSAPDRLPITTRVAEPGQSHRARVVTQKSPIKV